MEIDAEAISQLIFEITERIELIMKCVPKDKESILRHLAASSIHLAFFIRKIAEETGIESIKDRETLKAIDGFLDECGCNYKQMEK